MECPIVPFHTKKCPKNRSIGICLFLPYHGLNNPHWASLFNFFDISPHLNICSDWTFWFQIVIRMVNWIDTAITVFCLLHRMGLLTVSMVLTTKGHCKLWDCNHFSSDALLIPCRHVEALLGGTRRSYAYIICYTLWPLHHLLIVQESDLKIQNLTHIVIAWPPNAYNILVAPVKNWTLSTAPTCSTPETYISK